MVDLPVFEHGEKFSHFFLKKSNAVHLMADGSKSLALDVAEGVIIELPSVVKEINSGCSGDDAASVEGTHVDKNDDEEAYVVNTEEVDEEKVWYNAILSLKPRQRES